MIQARHCLVVSDISPFDIEAAGFFWDCRFGSKRQDATPSLPISSAMADTDEVVIADFCRNVAYQTLTSRT
jgi:hypothetical protein